MVNGIGCVHTFGKYNRQQPIAINKPLDTPLTNSDIHNKYNEKIDVGSKEPIRA